MKSLRFAAALALLLPLADIGSASADKRERRDTDSEARESLQNATEVYRSIAQDRERKVPSSVLNQAKCVAIFPDAVTVSLGVGGVHSDGVAFCKSSAGNWENPMFINLTGGSIGVQAGVKSADVVMYITGDRAANELRNGRFTVGGELSAVAGTFEETFRPMQNTQIVSYTRTQGLFAGASVDGVNVSRDRDEESSFYGTENPSMSAKIPQDAQNLVSSLKQSLPGNVG